MHNMLTNRSLTSFNNILLYLGKSSLHMNKIDGACKSKTSSFRKVYDNIAKSFRSNIQGVNLIKVNYMHV
jgi:hypothetical protein